MAGLCLRLLCFNCDIFLHFQQENMLHSTSIKTSAASSAGLVYPNSMEAMLIIKVLMETDQHKAAEGLNTAPGPKQVTVTCESME